MLKTFLGRSLGAKSAPLAPPESLPRRGIDLDRLTTLIEFFPIGKKLRYYPARQKEIVFDTFVVAYCVNGHFVYSTAAIDRDAHGRPTAFHAGAAERRTAIPRPTHFQLLVPDTSHLEMKLDYHRRALIGRNGQFKTGNCISLISNVGSKGVSTLDTEVSQQIVMKDGPYEQSNMVLLTPRLNTLALTDQRGNSRAKVCAPVTVSLVDQHASGICTIVDMSESALHIRMPDRDARMSALQKGSDVFLDIDLGEPVRHYTLKGTVLRRSHEACVIRLAGLVKDGKIGKSGALDLLELKAGLLNYGA